MDLPGLFGTTLDSIPGATPYLFADPADMKAWAARLAAFSGERRVGLVWSGDSRKHNPDANVVCTAGAACSRHLEPLAGAPDTRFISLQKGRARRTGASSSARGMQIIDMTDDLNDFSDTAALIMNLDLVITVDTSVAHLVGALGKPVWILSRFDGCWRWLNHREDSPWYPTARLFHQKNAGVWDEVMDRVAAELSV